MALTAQERARRMRKIFNLLKSEMSICLPHGEGSDFDKFYKQVIELKTKCLRATSAPGEYSSEEDVYRANEKGLEERKKAMHGRPDPNGIADRVPTFQELEQAGL